VVYRGSRRVSSVLQGRHQWRSRPRGWVTRALRCYEHAIEKDPSYPLARAAASQVHGISGFYGFLPPKAAFSRARAVVEALGTWRGSDVRLGPLSALGCEFWNFL
jgi:hypothetical protein